MSKLETSWIFHGEPDNEVFEIDFEKLIQDEIKKKKDEEIKSKAIINKKIIDFWRKKGYKIYKYPNHINNFLKLDVSIIEAIIPFEKVKSKCYAEICLNSNNLKLTSNIVLCGKFPVCKNCFFYNL